MALLVPSILSADFSRLAEQIHAVERAGVEMLHVDVMDGHFVPNITMGPPVLRSIRAATKLKLDVHLMIENADTFIDAFAGAGADMISVHVEACPHLHRTVTSIKAHGCKAGVVLNPATPLESLEEIFPVADFVLLMSVNPGWGGQEFIPRVRDKMSDLRETVQRRNLPTLLEVDGGITRDNIAGMVGAGASMIVAGSAVFGRPDPGAAAADLMAVMRSGGG
ncbi:MAG: ribulose-phosphate 3-epimerase [Acidobacteriota bacterium]